LSLQPPAGPVEPRRAQGWAHGRPWRIRTAIDSGSWNAAGPGLGVLCSSRMSRIRNPGVSSEGRELSRRSLARQKPGRGWALQGAGRKLDTLVGDTIVASKMISGWHDSDEQEEGAFKGFRHERVIVFTDGTELYVCAIRVPVCLSADGYHPCQTYRDWWTWLHRLQEDRGGRSVRDEALA
jgi:hypothetical protein